MEGRKPNSSRHKLEALLKDDYGWEAVDELLSHPLCIALLKKKDHPVAAMVSTVEGGYYSEWVEKAKKAEKRRPARPPASAQPPPRTMVPPCPTTR